MGGLCGGPKKERIIKYKPIFVKRKHMGKPSSETAAFMEQMSELNPDDVLLSEANIVRKRVENKSLIMSQ